MSTKQNRLFKLYTDEELRIADPSQFCYFGWDRSDDYSFKRMAEGYREAADVVYEKMKNCNGDIGCLDTLVYPLCYLYRHAVELYLKYIFFKYKKDEKERKDFLKDNGHHLDCIWKEIKPILSQGRKKVGSSVSIGDVEQYIKEMQKFDDSSEKMRFPMSKDLKPSQKDSKLDITNFHQEMEKLMTMLEQLDADVDNQVTISHSEEEIDSFLSIVTKYREEIVKVIERIKNDPDVLLNEILANVSIDMQILLDILSYTGRDIKNDHLSKNPKDRKREIASCCLDYKQDQNLQFGNPTQDIYLRFTTLQNHWIVEYVENMLNKLM